MARGVGRDELDAQRFEGADEFISESTLPRITPSLASMRWMVGSDSPAASASWR
jgi:hypothetical protein